MINNIFIYIIYVSVSILVFLINSYVGLLLIVFSYLLLFILNYKKNGTNSLIVTMLTDGGLPIKRFVEGRDVSPNISSVIGNSSKCIEFDFKQIYLST